MEINPKIAELARECNRLNKKYAEACYKRVMNVLFTETGEPYVIDEKVTAEYESIKYELSTKIDELDDAIKESEYEETTEHETNTVQD